MANAAAIKDVGAYSGRLESIELLYNFDNDTGAQADYELGTAKEDLIILGAATHVDEAFTSGGALTLEVGTSDDRDAILASTAVGSLTANATFAADAASVNKRVASGATFSATIGAADATAGKLRVILLVMKLGPID